MFDVKWKHIRKHYRKLKRIFYKKLKKCIKTKKFYKNGKN